MGDNTRSSSFRSSTFQNGRLFFFWFVDMYWPKGILPELLQKYDCHPGRSQSNGWPALPAMAKWSSLVRNDDVQSRWRHKNQLLTVEDGEIDSVSHSIPYMKNHIWVDVHPFTQLFSCFHCLIWFNVLFYPAFEPYISHCSMIVSPTSMESLWQRQRGDQAIWWARVFFDTWGEAPRMPFRATVDISMGQKGGFNSHGGTSNSWMVFSGKSHENGWFGWLVDS